MPIVVNPSFVWPPETDPVVSPDGRVTAIVDPANAGVLLRANFDDSVPDTPAQPEQVLRRNLVKYPMGSDATGRTGWQISPGAELLTFISDDGGYPALEVSDPTGGNSAYVDPTERLEPKLGQWIAFGAEIKGLDGYRAQNMRLRISGYSGTTATENPTNKPVSTSAYTRITLAARITAYSPGGYVRTLTWPLDTDSPGGFRIRRVAAAIADTEAEALAGVATYFDGGTPASGDKRYRYASDGTSEEYTPATPFIPGHGATTAKVRFERQDGTVVRSGNPAWAPSGYAHAYDHEATLGGGTLWRAVPIHFDGTEGTPSEYVGAVIPALSDGWAWLKPVNDPNKAMLLKVEPPDLSYDGRVDTTSIAGSARPAATWDVLEGFTTQLRSLVREKPVADHLMTLLDEGPVLAQFPACAGLPDFYFIRGKVDLEHVHWDGYPWRRYQWDVISIDRPDTTDSPMRIPDLSYDTVERDWTTYDQLKSTVASYNKLLEP